MNDRWPSELKVKDQGKTLLITFDDGAAYAISAELLRVESPSAEVKGHGHGQETLVYGKKLVTITGIEPVGNYAARLKFSDGHSTGLYTWTYLEKLGQEYHDLWDAYLAKLKEEGRSREP